MHDLTEQVERLAMMALLFVFGAGLASGLLAALRWQDVVVALAIIFVVRPVAGWVGLMGSSTTHGKHAAISFFDIRGVGSFYYLAFALNDADFSEAGRLWGIVALVALLSILIHGLTVTPLIRLLDRSHGRDPDDVHREAISPSGQLGPAGRGEKSAKRLRLRPISTATPVRAARLRSSIDRIGKALRKSRSYANRYNSC